MALGFSREKVGRAGEAAAASFLKNLGYKILDRHATALWAELDIIADDGGTIVFVEVRTVSSPGAVRPEDTVIGKKRQHVERSIQLYLNQKNWHQRPWRFDVIAVELSTEPPVIRHYLGV